MVDFNRMLREAEIEATFTRKMRGRGFLVCKIQGAAGWPDRMFLKDGVALFAEFKRPQDGELSPMQKFVIGNLRDNGFISEVITDYDDKTVAAFAGRIDEARGNVG